MLQKNTWDSGNALWFRFHISIKLRVSEDCERGSDPSLILVLSLAFGDEPIFFCAYLVFLQRLIRKIMVSMLHFVSLGFV